MACPKAYGMHKRAGLPEKALAIYHLGNYLFIYFAKF